MTELLPPIVYVLANPVMPGLVKLGKTTQQEAKQALHGAFGANRIHPIRVFFKPSRRPRRKLCELAIPHGLILLSAEDVALHLRRRSRDGAICPRYGSGGRRAIA